jgi:nucleoside-diphosphate-sugar epimerase
VIMALVLVSGAAGFVGANLVRRLLTDGHEVHRLIKPDSDQWRLDEIHREVNRHEVDLRHESELVALCRHIRPQWIFHLAAHGAYPRQTDTHRMIQTNIAGTLNLLRAALSVGFEAFVNTGSSSEYGFRDHPPHETEGVEPNSDYGVTKASATLLCRSIARRYRVRLPTLRLYSVYGPYEDATRLMPTLIVRGLHNEFPPLVRPEIARDYLYVGDVVDAYLRAAVYADQELGAVYNVASGNQTSVGELVELTRHVLGVTAEAGWGSMPDRSWDTTVWVGNSSKIRERLGWYPHHTLEAGFRKVTDWLVANPQLLAGYAARQRANDTGTAASVGARQFPT